MLYKRRLKESIMEELTVNLAYLLGYITPTPDGLNNTRNFLSKDSLEVANAEREIVDDLKIYFVLQGKSPLFYIFKKEHIEEIYRRITRKGVITGLPFTETPRYLYLAYLLGFINRIGGINFREEPELVIPPNFPKEVLHSFRQYLAVEGFSFENGLGNSVIFRGVNCIDLLGQLYGSGVSRFSLQWKSHYDFARNFSHRDYLANCVSERVPKLMVLKGDPKAVIPSKNKESDAGFDITAISLKKTTKIGETDIYYFDTGLIVAPEPGYYLEIIPRSSIVKSGWMLANSVGIIDASYRGSLLIVLARVDPKAEDLELPCRIAQLIPRRMIPMDIEEVSELNGTSRGEKGFGSSGK